MVRRKSFQIYFTAHDFGHGAGIFGERISKTIWRKRISSFIKLGGCGAFFAVEFPSERSFARTRIFACWRIVLLVPPWRDCAMSCKTYSFGKFWGKPEDRILRQTTSPFPFP